jgi:hypothetical protein
LLIEVLGEDCDILEAWSDAARAASIAARRTKAKGGDWRKAARKAVAGERGAAAGAPIGSDNTKVGVFEHLAAKGGWEKDRARRGARFAPAQTVSASAVDHGPMGKLAAREKAPRVFHNNLLLRGGTHEDHMDDNYFRATGRRRRR